MRETFKGNLILLISLTYIFIFFYGCGKTTEEQNRSREKFNSGWKFSKGDIEHAQAVDFTDAEWRSLNLPHDWAIEGPFSQEVYFQGGFLPYPGIGWYRKTFTFNEAGKNVLLEFDGVMMNAKVWVNGIHAGGWGFGYTSFAIDITKYLKLNEENVIAVRVENLDYSSRWYPGSAIYRNVWLTVTNPVHVAHWGTFVTTPLVTDENASVKVETSIENQTEQSQEIELETSILDKEGRLVASVTSPGKLEKNNSIEIESEFEIDNPNR